MAKALKTIAAEIAYGLGVEYGDYDNRELFDDWLQEVIHEFYTETDWPFAKQEETIASVASQENYTLAAGTGEITAVFDTSNNDALVQREKDDLLEKHQDYDMTGTPDYWYHNGTSSGQKIIGLWPVPDSVINYLVRSVLEPSTLTRTTVLSMPDDCIPWLKHRVRQMWREHNKDYEGAAFSQNAATRLMLRLKRKHVTGQTRSTVFKASDVSPSGYVRHIRFPDVIV